MRSWDITAIAAAFSLRIVYPFAVHFRRNLHFAVIKFARDHWNNLLTAQDIKCVFIFISLIFFCKAAVSLAVNTGVRPGVIIVIVLYRRIQDIAVFFGKATVQLLIFVALPIHLIPKIGVVSPPQTV